MRLLVICVTALAFGFFGSVPLAGPIAVMVLSRATRGRFGDALRIALGASVAEGLYAAAAFWGYTTFLADHALVVPLSRAATALVLVPIGVHFLFWKPTDRDDRREHHAGTALLGFTVCALNPTLLVTWSAAVAFLYSGRVESPSAAHAIPFGLCAAAGVASWFFVLLRLVRTYGGRIRSADLTRVVRALGLVLLAMGLWSGIRLWAWHVGARGA